MATQTTNTKTTDPFDFQGALERWSEATRKAGNDYLDLYEKTVGQMADLEVKTAKAIKLPLVAEVAEAHATASREFAGRYATTVRELLKA
jgi:predicted Zn-dependent protease